MGEVSGDYGKAVDDVYITGIAGYFPKSNSVMELQENLFNKVDLISDEEIRWTKSLSEIPPSVGIINNIQKFDASFFGVGSKEAHSMDPSSRLLMERVYECLIDAGVNMSELRNTNTGVFVGNCLSESERIWYYERMEVNDFGATGCSRAMAANRISRWLGLKGPSYAIDTACSSSFYALENAYKAIREGVCDAAIVAGLNLCLNPCTSLLFARLGVLSPNGRCKSFDSRANGYGRSESIVACFLQKAKDSRRVHAKLVHGKTNCDGYKDKGITYPSGRVQKVLLESFYAECGVAPSSVEFVEAHATGTFVGDPEELEAIDEIFCKDRKETLLIGSIKSNLGHSEASSGLNSLAKACIAYNTGYIPPNINFIKPREDIPGLVEGRLRVVLEKTPWNRGCLAMNSFGFGGANAHILLGNVPKEKINNGLPADSIPRLVCVSGRTESAVAKILDTLESRPVDGEEVRLWHAIHERNIPGHEYRGFVLLNIAKTTSNGGVRLDRDIRCASSIRNPSVWFKYTDLQTHWSALAKQFIILPAFAAAFTKCSSALQEKGVDLIQLLDGDDAEIEMHNNLSPVGSAAVHIALTDVLKIIGIRPDNIIDSEVGEICRSYADGCLTIEQAMTAAYNSSYPKPNPLLSKNRPKNWLSRIDELVANAPSVTNAIVIEVGFHEDWETDQDFILDQEGTSSVPLCKESGDTVQYMLSALGKLYELGLNPLLANIYPAVTFPVAQGTPMLSHLVEWDHTDDWIVIKYDNYAVKLPYGQRKVQIRTTDDRYSYITGHSINDRVIIPGMFYIFLVWETYALMKGCLFTELSVEFRDVLFKRATYNPKDGVLNFTVTLHESGQFEITENDATVANGYIYEKEHCEQKSNDSDYTPEDPDLSSVTDIMNRKDFYKELFIRGYEYTGLFKAVESCSVDGGRGRIAWENNWVAFIDNMLQAMMTPKDTRLLYIPTRIESLSIDVATHKRILQAKDKDDCFIDFRFNKQTCEIRAGGLKLSNIDAITISRKPSNGIPVYEKNVFISNYSTEKMSVENILRCDLQLIYENIQTTKLKSIELIDIEYKSHNLQPFSEMVASVLADLPLAQAEMLVLCDEPINMPSSIKVADKMLPEDTNYVLFIGANLLKRQNVLNDALASLQKGGFILSRETTFTSQNYSSRYNILTAHKIGSEHIVLIREKIESLPTKYIQILTKDRKFSWINDVKKELKEEQKIVLYNQYEPVNGLLGLVNCLRRELGGGMVRGLLIADPAAPPFNRDSTFYKDHLDKGLAINIFKNNQWGTYRHLLLDTMDTVPTPHAYVNIGTLGDLSSLRWWEGQHSEVQNPSDPKLSLIQVYASGLNFRDAMTALERVSVDAVAEGRLAQECVQGMEYAGRTANGIRVMGTGKQAIANLVEMEVDNNLIWPVPDEWTFEEAVTVPIAYLTAYLALVMMGKIRSGDSILIHAGSGGVGQAAISVALHHGLDVFTTVGTSGKRDFIKKLFPQLKDSHIGNSRDTSFEDMIRSETGGSGVDVVLNSLADDKLQASIRCLKNNGRFLEIGKYDITMNTQIEIGLFHDMISFYGVMLDYVFFKKSIRILKTLRNLVLNGIVTGAVRPLTHCTFDKHEVQAAYRYMAAGKHIGKVIIKIREEEPQTIVKPTPMLIDAVPRYICTNIHVYILIGGLGGFGLELADRLVMRGARKILLVSRKGVSNGYQSLRIRHWKSYGARIEISTHDVTTETGCEGMLKMAAAMGPVRAIFNLAVVLNDAAFENQTPDSFENSFGPKALTTIHLDKLSRTLCPELKDFVIFSSISCGRGNAGQTNYGFSNSVMERICEERKSNGLPAVAIQWGAIGDVGLIADKQENNVQLEIGGTLQQRISSCLDALDTLLKQDAAIVSSMVVTKKRILNTVAKRLVDVISQILGVNDLKTVSRQVPLSELGMDSVMAMEIKQTLERDFAINLTAQEIRLLTLAKLSEYAASNSTKDGQSSTPPATTNEALAFGLDMLVRNFGDEELATEPYVYLNSKNSNNIGLPENNVLFLLPGIEGSANTFKNLCSKLNVKTCVLQLGLNPKEHRLEQLIESLHRTITTVLRPGSTYMLLGYSFGAVLVLGLAAKLEAEGYRGVVICLDGSPEYTQALAKRVVTSSDDAQIQNHIICHSFNILCPNHDIYQRLIEKLPLIESYENRIKCALEICPVKLKYSDEFMFSIAKVTYNRIKMMIDLSAKKFLKINSPIVLVRITNATNMVESNENYGLDKFTQSDVTVHYVDTNHSNIVETDECAHILEKILANFSKSKSLLRFGTK